MFNGKVKFKMELSSVFWAVVTTGSYTETVIKSSQNNFIRGFSISVPIYYGKSDAFHTKEKWGYSSSASGKWLSCEYNPYLPKFPVHWAVNYTQFLPNILLLYRSLWNFPVKYRLNFKPCPFFLPSPPLKILLVPLCSEDILECDLRSVAPNFIGP